MREKGFTAAEVIAALGLEPLSREGGLFRRTWARYTPEGGQCTASAIYYLLCDGQFSHLHRLTCDEVYTYISGAPLELLELRPDGSAQRHILGADVEKGQEPQVVVERGVWQGSRLCPGGSWGLVSTVCCPGFTEDAYEHCLHRTALLRADPSWEELLRALCPEE